VDTGNTYPGFRQYKYSSGWLQGSENMHMKSETAVLGVTAF